MGAIDTLKTPLQILEAGPPINSMTDKTLLRENTESLWTVHYVSHRHPTQISYRHHVRAILPDIEETHNATADDGVYSGGGMGGLFVGLCLKKYAPAVHFDIYEAATELTELGAGITMSPRTWSLMAELGLRDELLPTTGTQDPTGAWISTSRLCRCLPCLLQWRLSLSSKATKTHL